MAISLNMNNYKSAGLYTLEIDETATSVVEENALRLLVGFANRGVFNRPVFLSREEQIDAIFGPINTKLEHKGCFFNRFARTMIRVSPILALNLLKVDDSEKGPDQVNFATLSLDAGSPNPTPLSAGLTYGEYDHLCAGLDKTVYDTNENGDVIPFVGKTPYSSLYDRSKFWIPSPENLMAVAANKLQTGDEGSFEHSNLLNFANVGTEEFSVLVYKAEGIAGWDVTASEWYGGVENIPFGWIRPTDYISDYFINVICVKGNWSDTPHLATDPVWASYFNTNGIEKSKIKSFLGAEGVQIIGSWTGAIIPDLMDKQGNPQNIFNKINNSIESTGLMVSFNEDAAQVLAYDYNGTDNDTDNGSGCWFYDIDGDRQYEAAQGESHASSYLIDMVGHNFQAGFKDEKNDKMEDYYVNEPIDSSKLGAMKHQVETYYLKSSGELASSSFEAVDGEFTYNGGQKTIVSKYGIVEMTQSRMLVKFDEKLAGIKLMMKIVKKNRIDIEKAIVTLDSTGLLDTTSIKSDDITSYKADNETAINTDIKAISPFVEGDVVYIGLESNSSATTALNKNEKLSFRDKPIVYTVPALDNRSVVFDAPYGLYLVVSKSAAGEIEKADVYRLYAKASTKGNKTKYTDVFEKYVSDVDLDVVKPTAQSGECECESVYRLTYPNTAKRVIYEIHNNIATHHNASGQAVIYYNTGVGGAKRLYGVNFLSYAKVLEQSDVVTNLIGVSYFAKASVSKSPVAADNKNMFIITDEASAKSIKVGDLVNNIAFENEIGVAQKYNLIPGLTRVISKIFVSVTTGTNKFTYKGVEYEYNKDLDLIKNSDFGTQGFYLVSTIDPVKIYENVNVETQFINYKGINWYPVIADESRFVEGGGRVTDTTEPVPVISWEDETGVDINTYIRESIGGITVDDRITLNAMANQSSVDDGTAEPNTDNPLATITDDVVYIVVKKSAIKRQLPLSDDAYSNTLRFIPMKGLSITSRHKPGYDKDGNIDVEAGIEKIYSVLLESGILRGLKNPEMANYRYIIDSMSYGLDAGLGGKKYVSYVAKQRSKCTAFLNLPSQKQFAASTNPIFCDSYVSGTTVKPPFNTRYVAEGGNSEMYATKIFSLPGEDDGSKYAAAFWPNLIYTVNGKKISVPPAADISNSFIRKHLGGDPYIIVANLNGIIDNPYVTGVEYKADQEDRDYLEPMGVNTIISRSGDIMIYGNQTCYQKLRSDFNKLHVREILNSIEISCEAELQRFNFLYNNAVTRSAAVTAVTPILSALVNAGAIASYTIQCDENNNSSYIIDNSALLLEIGVTMNMGMEKIIVPITVRKRVDA